MTVEIKHSLHFITEIDETHPVGKQLLALEKGMQTEMLESMLKEMIVPAIQPTLKKINENGTYAILKVAE